MRNCHSLNADSRCLLTALYLQGWNYNHVSSLWLRDNWINEDDAETARTHYGGFSTLTKDGLRVISINTEWLYNANLYNYINVSNPDASGTMAWMASELQRSEDRHERVWIIGHVPAGWDGRSALPNPADLFNRIVSHLDIGSAFGLENDI